MNTSEFTFSSILHVLLIEGFVLASVRGHRGRMSGARMFNNSIFNPIYENLHTNSTVITKKKHPENLHTNSTVITKKTFHTQNITLSNLISAVSRKRQKP